jgi:hypothetical protein
MGNMDLTLNNSNNLLEHFHCILNFILTNLMCFTTLLNLPIDLSMLTQDMDNMDFTLNNSEHLLEHFHYTSDFLLIILMC